MSDLLTDDQARIKAWERVNLAIAIADLEWTVVLAKNTLEEAEKRQAFTRSTERFQYWEHYFERCKNVGFFTLDNPFAERAEADKAVDKAVDDLGRAEYKLRKLREREA